MAKKNYVKLEDVELKPQVIGQLYKKKSNLLRVLFVFAVLILVVYYINDITVWFNDLLGRQSSTSIRDLASKENNNQEREVKDLVFICKKDFESLEYSFSNNLLNTVKHVIQNNKNENNYEASLLEQKNLVNSLNIKTGYKASIDEDDNGYTVTIIVDLKDIDTDVINNLYYNYQKESNEIYVDLQSKGYSCD